MRLSARMLVWAMLAAAACNAAWGQAGPVPIPRMVMVSIAPQKFLVDRIGRSLVDTSVMLPPALSPETFDPTPSQMALVSRARLYFPIGVPFERNWLPNIARQYPELEIVPCCDQLKVTGDEGGGAVDPHLWMDPLVFLKVAVLVHDALVMRDVGNRQVYDTNYRKLSEELRFLHLDLQYLLRDRRIDEFIISHAALGPFARAYGLKQVALESAGRELGPRELQGVVKLAREKGIHTVFVVRQHGRAPAAALADEIGATLVEIDPLAEDYLDNMRAIGRQLAEATR